MAAGWVTVFTRIHQVPVSKKLAMYLVILGLYAWGVDVAESDLLKGIVSATSGAVYGSLIMGVLLVFRTNSAYDRWWEGRKLWGQLINESRNLSLKMKAYAHVTPSELADFGRLQSAFAFALMKHLRDEPGLNKIPGFENAPEDPAHAPAYITDLMFQRIRVWRDQGKIDGFGLMQIDPHVRALMDICGACERIKNSPIALSYRAIIRQGIGLNLLGLPWYLAPDCQIWTVPVTLVAAYFMIGLELIAEDIEEPFGHGDDNLPLDKLCQTIDASVHQILVEPLPTVIPDPSTFPVLEAVEAKSTVKSLEELPASSSN